MCIGYYGAFPLGQILQPPFVDFNGSQVWAAELILAGYTAIGLRGKQAVIAEDMGCDSDAIPFCDRSNNIYETALRGTRITAPTIVWRPGEAFGQRQVQVIIEQTFDLFNRCIFLEDGENVDGIGATICADLNAGQNDEPFSRDLFGCLA